MPPRLRPAKQARPPHLRLLEALKRRLQQRLHRRVALQLDQRREVLPPEEAPQRRERAAQARLDLVPGALGGGARGGRVVGEGRQQHLAGRVKHGVAQHLGDAQHCGVADRAARRRGVAHGLRRGGARRGG
jgi:hypothetical protein